MANCERRCPVDNSESQDVFQSRMKAQCEAIARYRSHAIRDEGRELSMEEAAREWIEQFAGSFAKDYEAR